MDLLREAWELLEEDERPEGMSYRPHDSHFRFCGCWSAYSKVEARDRMIVAVEGVLCLKYDGSIWFVDGDDGGWCASTNTAEYVDPDRLAAAVAALRAERGGAK